MLSRYISISVIAASKKVSATFTKKDIEEAIQKWLKSAKERCDAEQKRLNVQRLPWESVLCGCNDVTSA